MTANGLGRYIYEAPWAPAPYHTPDDDEDLDGLRNTVSFIHLMQLIAEKTLLKDCVMVKMHITCSLHLTI
jgi:hypothetical protein